MLLQTFRNLIPEADSSEESGVLYNSNVSVEKSGCLSQCDRGPNICTVNDKNEEKLYVGISDATTASAILEVVTGKDYPIALLLAATLINDSQQATKPSKKEQLLSSAIDAISKEENDATIQNSYAHAHALLLRADAFLEMTPPNIDGALFDARKSVKIAPRERKAWRVLACAEEAGGNYTLAIDALREVAKLDPSFSTKARKEIERLVSIAT